MLTSLDSPRLIPVFALRYLEAQALSTRSMAVSGPAVQSSVMASHAQTVNSENTSERSRPTSSQHEEEMARLLEVHGHPLHDPVLPIRVRDSMMVESRARREPMHDPGLARVLDADRRLAEHLQAEENRRGYQQIEGTSVRKEGIERGRPSSEENGPSVEKNCRPGNF